jgi:hypothetical protein
MQSQQDQHLGVSSNNGMESTMAEQVAKLQSKYGSLPSFSKSLLGQQRKYFDSGDYALSLAGKKDTTVGSEHPQPENIPHSIPVNPVYGSVPARRGSLANMSIQGNSGGEQQTL